MPSSSGPRVQSAEVRPRLSRDQHSCFEPAARTYARSARRRSASLRRDDVVHDTTNTHKRTRARSQHRSLLRTDTPFPANIIITRLRSAAADSSRPPERRRLTGGGNGGGGGSVLIPGEASARRPTQSVRNHRVGSVTNVTILD